MTVTATWLGGPGEPESCEWMGVTFPKGEPVEISNEFQIRKAKGNPFFDVEDADADDKKPAAADRMAAARAAKAAAKAAAAAATLANADDGKIDA